MNRKPNLATALHEASGKKQPVIVKTADEALPIINAVKVAPSRIGKRVVAGHFDSAVIRQLKLLAIDNHSSIQGMLTEALNDLFEKHNMKPIA